MLSVFGASVGAVGLNRPVSAARIGLTARFVLKAVGDNGPYLPFTRAFRHAARAIAFAAKADVIDARKEQADFLAGARLIPAGESFGNNPATASVTIATHMVAGEILYRDGQVDAGLAELREAVKFDDALHYDEPSPWILPVRHSLGATLMNEHATRKPNRFIATI